MDSLIFELQIVLYFQLFLSANVRHTMVALLVFIMATLDANLGSFGGNVIKNPARNIFYINFTQIENVS